MPRLSAAMAMFCSAALTSATGDKASFLAARRTMVGAL